MVQDLFGKVAYELGDRGMSIDKILDMIKLSYTKTPMYIVSEVHVWKENRK